MLVNKLTSPFQRALASLLRDLSRCHRLFQLNQISASLDIAFCGCERNMNVEGNPFFRFGTANSPLVLLGRFPLPTATRGDLVGGSCYFESISVLARFAQGRPNRDTA